MRDCLAGRGFPLPFTYLVLPEYLVGFGRWPKEQVVSASGPGVLWVLGALGSSHP